MLFSAMNFTGILKILKIKEGFNSNRSCHCDLFVLIYYLIFPYQIINFLQEGEDNHIKLALNSRSQKISYFKLQCEKVGFSLLTSYHGTL